MPAEVKKGHEFLFARQGLSPLEQDMLLLFFTQIEREHADAAGEVMMPTYRFDAGVLCQWFNVPSSRNLASVLRPAASRLAGQVVGLEQRKGSTVRFDYRPIFARVAYEDGVLTMVPNQMMWPELFEYSRGFALINHRTMRSIKGQYAKRLYELLSRFKDNGSRLYMIRIESLMGVMGVFDQDNKIQVKSFDGPRGVTIFVDRCVRGAIRELMEHPEVKQELAFLEVEGGSRGYRTIKEGGKITKIEFQYFWIPAKGSVDEAIVAEARATIVKLTKLRAHRKLTDEELNDLLNAYLTADAGYFAGEIAKIQAALAKRQEDAKVAQAKAVNEEPQPTGFVEQVGTMVQQLQQLGVSDY